MSTQSLYTITLVIAYFLELGLSLYLNETVVVNLDLTIITQSQLNISENDIQSVIEAAYISANSVNAIHAIDNIQFTSNFHFYNEYNEYEYMALLNVYFQSKSGYDYAVDNGYTKFIYTSLPEFITNFENTIKANLFSTIQPDDIHFVEDVLINSMKIIQFQIKTNFGSLMIHYKGDVTTTTEPTTFTLSPTTIIPSHSPTQQPSSPPSTQQALSSPSSNYAFKQESTYWILIVLFLFIGCFIGCCCIYAINTLLKSRADENPKTLHEVQAHSSPRQKQYSSPRQTTSTPIKKAKNPSKRNSNNSIQMSEKEKQKKPAKKRSKKRKKKRSATAENIAAHERVKPPLSEEELQKKRERYIEYGSDDESEQDEVFKDPVQKTRNRPQSEIVAVAITTRGISSDDDSVEEIMSKTRGGDTPTGTEHDSGDVTSPRSRNKNTKTGTIEPDRYDFDGNRKLTTKELLTLYKKNRQKGGDSVDLSYKISSSLQLKGGREEKEGGDEDSDMDESEGNEYEFERTYRRQKVNKNKNKNKVDGSSRDRKRRSGREKKRHLRRGTGDYNSGKKMKHKRSNTGTLTKRSRRHRSTSQGKNKLKKKYIRPKSARFNSNKKRQIRPKSARPLQMTQGGGSNRSSIKFEKRNSNNRYNGDSDSEDDDEQEDSYTPEPKEINRDDYD